MPNKISKTVHSRTAHPSPLIVSNWLFPVPVSHVTRVPRVRRKSVPRHAITLLLPLNLDTQVMSWAFVASWRRPLQLASSHSFESHYVNRPFTKLCLNYNWQLGEHVVYIYSRLLLAIHACKTTSWSHLLTMFDFVNHCPTLSRNNSEVRLTTVHIL